MKESSLQRKPVLFPTQASRPCVGGGGAKKIKTQTVGDNKGPCSCMAVSICF